MTVLAAGWSFEVDTLGKGAWAEVLAGFRDANFYQTWSYGAVRVGENRLSRIVLKSDGEIVAAAQARIMTVPVLGTGIAYVHWGPLWRPAGRDENPDYFRAILRALRETYSREMGLLLVLTPAAVEDGRGMLRRILEEESFRRRRDVEPYRTLLIDLSLSLDSLRAGLRKTWRHSLRRGETEKLETLEGGTLDLYDQGLEIYGEMLRRKRFARFVDVREIRAVLAGLGEKLPFRTVVMRHGGTPVGSLTYSDIGESSLVITASTATKGLGLNSSKVMWWKMIERQKADGRRWCDLGGIDPEGNPGTYTFKAGLAGKTGRDVCFLGQYETCENRWRATLFRRLDAGRIRFRRMKMQMKRSGTAAGTGSSSGQPER